MTVVSKKAYATVICVQIVVNQLKSSEAKPYHFWPATKKCLTISIDTSVKFFQNGVEIIIDLIDIVMTLSDS